MVRPPDQQTTTLDPAITAVHRTRLFESVVAQLRELIRDGKLLPGQRLPSEREMAQRFQVSRASVREAVRALEQEGLVATRSGAGTFVSEEGFDAAVDVLAKRLLAGREVVADILELRLLLEPQIAALAAQRATAGDKEQMAAILREQEAQVAEGETGAAADVAFHSTVASASHNQVLERLSATLADLLSPIRDEGLQTPDRSYSSLRTHRAILQAIEAGDQEAARLAMQEHIEGVERELSQDSPGRQ
ncbi:MAG: FadR family transcriptional regulator [Chloroflexi bacterium]|nr:FadR family transcriptional regulator [Chloroflexota bacterium]